MIHDDLYDMHNFLSTVLFDLCSISDVINSHRYRNHFKFFNWIRFFRKFTPCRHATGRWGSKRVGCRQHSRFFQSGRLCQRFSSFLSHFWPLFRQLERYQKLSPAHNQNNAFKFTLVNLVTIHSESLSSFSPSTRIFMESSFDYYVTYREPNFLLIWLKLNGINMTVNWDFLLV